jgi:hypothetical protein
MASIADEFRDEEICKEAVIVSEPHRRRRVPLRWFASKSLRFSAQIEQWLVACPVRALLRAITVTHG